MSIKHPEQPTQETSSIPDTMHYRPDEREYANDVKTEAEITKKNKFNTKLALWLGGGALAIGGIAAGYAATKAEGVREAADELNPDSAGAPVIPGTPETMTILNIEGDEITVESRDGQPWSDHNNNGVNDFEEDRSVPRDGIMDGYQFDESGTYILSGQELEELPVNNNLSETQVNDIIGYTDIIGRFPNAYNMIRNLEQDQADAVWAAVYKYHDYSELSRDQLSSLVVNLMGTNWEAHVTE